MSLLESAPTALLGRDYLASIAQHAFGRMSHAKTKHEAIVAWERLATHEQEALVQTVEAILLAMANEGWKFQPPGHR